MPCMFNVLYNLTVVYFVFVYYNKQSVISFANFFVFPAQFVTPEIDEIHWFETIISFRHLATNVALFVMSDDSLEVETLKSTESSFFKFIQ